MIIDIRKSICYYVNIAGEYHPHWRTDASGTHWENLMGMSWEEMDPDQSIIDEFKAAITRSATNGD